MLPHFRRCCLVVGCAIAALGWADRIRRAAWPAPFAVFMYTLLVKGALLDGWAGWFYALQRLFAETLIALEIIDKRLRRDG